MDIIDDIRDFIDSIPTWQKWLGTGTIGAILFFLFLLVFAGPQEAKQVAGIPLELKEIESNITEEYITKSSGPVSELIGEFRDTGDKEAKSVRDPTAAKVVRLSWSLLGVYLAALIIIIPVLAIHKVFRQIL